MTDAEMDTVYDLRDIITHRIKDVVEVQSSRLNAEQKRMLLLLLNEQFRFT
jgi:hypothetical protein